MKATIPLFALAGSLMLGGTWLAKHRVPAALPVAEVPGEQTRILYPAGQRSLVTFPDGRRESIQSLLNVDRRMHYGAFAWNDEGVPSGPSWVRVDLAAQTISVFRAGHEIGTAVILYGADSNKTPTGLFHIREKAENHWSRSYDAPMPYMLRLTDDGVAIHASDVEKGFATHGCVGVPRAFARHLFAAMNKGDAVLILPATPGQRT